MYLTIYRGSEIRDIAAVDYTAALRDEGWVLINPNPPLVPTSNADWNATSGDAQILNKPTLGTAAATNSTDYATAAQGAKADTALQPAEIGSTVLAYDANLQSFVSTFTLPTTDGTANQVLATNGAGVISFATPATLPDPAYIGGVAYFNRSTMPIGRSAGVPLVIGDCWYKTDDGTEWFWNGTYWLSPPENLQLPNYAPTAHTAIGSPVGGSTGIFIHTYQVAQQSANATANDANNYRNIELRIREKTGSNIELLVSTIQNYPLPIGQANSWTNTVNTNYLIANYSGLVIRVSVPVGTDGAYAHYTPIVTFSWSQ